MTTSSVKRNQRLCSLASIRPALVSDVTMLQPGIACAARSAASNASTTGNAVTSGSMSGYAACCCCASCGLRSSTLFARSAARAANTTLNAGGLARSVEMS
jgi:hypothetical protein